MSMYGADVDALEAAASQLDQAADQLDSSAQSLTATLGSVRWLGNIAVAFTDSWNSRHQPGLMRTSGFFRDNAATLRRQATEQRRASNSDAISGGGGAPGTAPVGSATDGRRDSEAARQSLMTAIDNMLKNQRFNDQFPSAMDALRQWRESFGDRLPTEAEAAQLERYLAAVRLANYDVAIMRDAAELAGAEFAEMTKAAGSALTGEIGGEAGVSAAFTSFVEDQIDGFVDGQVTDRVTGAATGAMSDAVAAAASRAFDAKLAALLPGAQSTNAVMHNDPSALALAHYETAASAIEVARATGDIADAFNPLTGDGSVVDSLLRNGLRVAPGAGTVLDIGGIAGSSAQAYYHLKAGCTALDVVMQQMSDFDRMTADVFELHP